MDVAAWDAEFVKVDQGTLISLALAADYLEIEHLMRLAKARARQLLAHGQ